jgi:hypothetical protein
MTETVAQTLTEMDILTLMAVGLLRMALTPSQVTLADGLMLMVTE